MRSYWTPGPVAGLDGTILGKLKTDADDDDKYSEYVTLRKNCGLTEHTMVYGATGSGKSRGFVKPFILQCIRRRESLILVDPKAEFYETMAGYLRDQGYEVKLFNLLDMENIDAWNCLAAVDGDPSMVQSIAEVIINNTSNTEDRQDFWSKAELNLLVAMIHYVHNRRGPDGKLLPIHERSLGAIYKMLASESFQSLDEIFSALPQSHPAKAPYGIFKLANRQIWGNMKERVGGVDRKCWHTDLFGLQRSDDGKVHLRQVRRRHHPGQQQSDAAHATVLTGLYKYPPLLTDAQQYPTAAHDAG